MSRAVRGVLGRSIGLIGPGWCRCALLSRPAARSSGCRRSRRPNRVRRRSPPPGTSGQAGRGEQRLRRDLGLAENAPAAGMHIGRGDEQLDRRATPAFEIDALPQHLLKRIEAHRIVVGREQRAIMSMARKPGELSSVQRPIIRSSGERWRGLKRPHRDTPPEGLKGRARALGAAPRHPSASTAAFMAPADVPEIPRLHPWLLQQPVDDTPGECAVRSAALQRQVDKNRLALNCRCFTGRRSHRCKLLTGYGADRVRSGRRFQLPTVFL